MCGRIDEEIGESVELGDSFLGCSRIEFDEEGLEHLSLGCLEIDEAAMKERSQHCPAIDEGTGGREAKIPYFFVLRRSFRSAEAVGNWSESVSH